MNNKSFFSILQVNAYDIGGGAEKVTWDLFRSYKDRGYTSYLAVGSKKTDDKNVIQIPNDECRSHWSRFWINSNEFLSFAVRRLPIVEHNFSTILTFIGQPLRTCKKLQGHEDFDYPGTWEILNLIPKIPEILHCHNLHGGYFDLRALPKLSHQVPLVITLHDAWSISGHCAHSLDCEKWKTGCGGCQDLSIYPEINRDATSYNLNIKKKIYDKSHLYVVTPCKWLMNKVDESILNSGVVDSRIIPNGVDTQIFQPYDKNKARQELGLSKNKKILLVAANGIRQNIWKDYETLRFALSRLSISQESLLCIALGEDAPTERIKEVEIKFVPYEKDPHRVARYYQAADIYVHPSRVDTFPNTILEALACGVPVVATSVGGIPEQIIEGKTGFLVPLGDAEKMANRIMSLLNDENLNRVISKQAAKYALEWFSKEKMVDNYIAFYRDILSNDSWHKPNCNKELIPKLL